MFYFLSLKKKFLLKQPVDLNFAMMQLLPNWEAGSQLVSRLTAAVELLVAAAAVLLLAAVEKLVTPLPLLPAAISSTSWAADSSCGGWDVKVESIGGDIISS